MSDPILEKLDAEWAASLRCQDYALSAKILRAKVNVLKAASTLSEHKTSLSTWVKTLEERLESMEATLSLTVIGHLRHARKSLALTASDVGSAFRSTISQKERARFRKRNRPPQLGITYRADLPAGFANGSPGLHLQPGVLGHDQS